MLQKCDCLHIILRITLFEDIKQSRWNLDSSMTVDNKKY